MNKNILLKSREITNKIESMILFSPNSLSNKLNSKIDEVKIENLFSLEGEYIKTICSLERMSKLIDLISNPIQKASTSIYKVIDNKIFDMNYNFSDFETNNFKME